MKLELSIYIPENGEIDIRVYVWYYILVKLVWDISISTSGA